MYLIQLYKITMNKKSKNYKKDLLFLVVNCLVVIGVLLYVDNLYSVKIETADNTVVGEVRDDNIQEIQPETYYQYLVPVSKFKNSKTNYSQQEFSESKLVTYIENKLFIPDQFQVEYIDKESILSELELGKIALLTPIQVDPKFKTIEIEGENFWSDSFDKENWSLVKEMKVNDMQYNFSSDFITNFFAAGEVIPARAVDRLGLNKYDNYTYLFESFRKDIESADISIALLENSLLGDPTPCTGCMMFQGDEKVLPGLVEVGFDFISLSGNHAGDAGQKGLMNTVEKFFIDENIQATGAGVWKGGSDNSNNLKPNTPIIKEVNGQRIGMISADDVAFYYWRADDSSDYATNHFSNRDSNGVVTLDTEKIELISKIKSENSIDYLIVYMSWGVEYTNKATSHQVKLGHEIIDNGADIIIGSHPHWVQNVEFYNDKPIIYSLGNFIFDQTHELETRQGAATSLYYYQNELKSIELMPHKICGYHQTNNDLAEKLISEELTLQDIDSTEEKDGCVYWMPRKLGEEEKDYKEVLERIFEHSEV